MRRLVVSVLVAALASGLALSLCAKDPAKDPSLTEELARVPAKEPNEALASFEVAGGFRMELVACEPVVADPIAAVYDPSGRLYVVEMRGYPYENERGTPPTGRVRLLEDRDADGLYEHSHVFADGLPCPTGIALWKGGAFVIAAPDIWYFKDTDGDGRADERRKAFSGFGTKNVQALANNLIWGIDHKMYGATAGNGGELRRADQPDSTPLVLRSQDFCFDPVTGALEAVSGTAQFGNSFDDGYDRFVCSNSNHAQHVVLPSRYLQRNPYLAVPRVLADIGAEGNSPPVHRLSQPEGWRIVRTRRRMAEGRANAGPLVEHDVFTSAAGITIYRGAAYPPEYRGNLFVSDVQGNLVHRKEVSAAGATFVARRADPKTEFVRSTDNWFRPVNFVNAPDGTLHVLDMYRETIEHPWSIPDDIRALLDLENGRDRGRIYRLAPPGFQLPPPPRLEAASTGELVRQIENPNGWWRETSQRLLYERQDASAVPGLHSLVRKANSPAASLHALWLLEGLGALELADLEAALGNGSARVREHAVRLAESRISQGSGSASSPLLERVLTLAADPDFRVRMQVALTLGEVTDPRAARALAAIVRRDLADAWMRTVVLSSASRFAFPILVHLLGDGLPPQPAALELVGQLARTAGAKSQPAEMGKLAELALQQDAAEIRRHLIIGLLEGTKRLSRGPSAAPLAPLVVQPVVDQLLAEAQKQVANPAAPLSERSSAIRLLGLGSFARVGRPLAELLDSRQPPELQINALRALSGFSDPAVAHALLEGWQGFTPDIRAEAVQVLLGRKPWTVALLDSLQSGRIDPAHIPAARKDLLQKHADPAIRERARALFGLQTASPRAQTVAQYQPALSLRGDPANGRKVFEKECATCHRLGQVGHVVGPDLATIRTRTPDALLVQILDPNREVLPNYLEYAIALADGRIATGVIGAESPTSITLKRPNNVQETILRGEIEAITSTGKSLMPEDVDKKIDPRQLADLIAFLLAP